MVVHPRSNNRTVPSKGDRQAVDIIHQSRQLKGGLFFVVKRQYGYD